MSWVTVIWSMTASACLTLALMNFFIWCRQRDAWANLLFALVAVGTAAIAGIELAMMRAETTASFALALRWIYVPACVVIMSLAGFVRLYLKTGRMWLLWSICGVRLLTLVLDFLLGQNLNFWEITNLRHIPFLGESVSVAEGVSNHWMLVAQASFLLLLIFVVDATITAWRFGDRRRALAIGGSVIFFVLAGTSEATLVLWQVLHWPVITSLPALATIGAMSFELSRDAQRAGQLARDLHESEQRMTQAADAANLGFWIRDLVRNEIWATDRWRKLLGFAPEETIDFDGYLQKLYPSDRDAVRQSQLKAIGGAGVYETVYRVQLPDGGVRWIASRGRVEFNAAGKPIRLRGISLDITHRRQAELEVAQQRSELAHLSRVTSVSELSGSLAHELNQPLAIILTNAQAAQRLLVQSPPDIAEALDILTDIISEDQRAGEVIRRLRALLKHGETTLQPLAVNDTLEQVLQLTRSDLIGQGVTVERNLARNLPPILGDSIQIQQVLLNLILNACDAMAANPSTSRHLSLTTVSGDKTVLISVSDTGCGLPPDAERVFQPFYTTKKQGLGLGLAICRSIITAHQGRLWAEAQGAADQKTTFHLELPVADRFIKPPFGEGWTNRDERGAI